MGDIVSLESQLFQPDSQFQLVFKKLQHCTRLEYPQNINHAYSHFCKIVTELKVGEGIRQTYAYHCLCTKEEFARQRQEFWETRLSGSALNWQLIKRAINALTEEEAMGVLAESRLKLIKRRIYLALDQCCVKYQVPIFVINQPLSFSQVLLSDRNLRHQFQIKDLRINVRFSNQFDKRFVFSSGATVAEFKAKVRASCQMEPGQGLIMIYGGKRLRDDHQLGLYGLKETQVVQAIRVAAQQR